MFARPATDKLVESLVGPVNETAASPSTVELDSSAVELEGQPTVIRFPVERVRRTA
jgi:hypothetical protein